jgi:CheY-like chemotaxis protein
VHFWPFDGWEIPEGKHAIVEVYPRLWKDLYPAEDRNGDQQDAYAVCRWLQESDANGELKKALAPELPAEVRKIASFEGWILGVKYDNSLKPAARPGRASRRTPKRSNAAAIHKERGALLCVDDEPSILAALEWEFRSEGFENILVASDGEEALRILTEHGDRVQVMTTNIRMPKLDGLSLIRHLAAHHRHPLVVIVISGVVSFEAAIQFMRSRSDVVVPFDYINKPYDPEHVVKRVRDAFAVAEYLRMK